MKKSKVCLIKNKIDAIFKFFNKKVIFVHILKAKLFYPKLSSTYTRSVWIINW